MLRATFLRKALGELKIGTRVMTTFAAERKGEMLNFWLKIAQPAA